MLYIITNWSLQRNNLASPYIWLSIRKICKQFEFVKNVWNPVSQVSFISSFLYFQIHDSFIDWGIEYLSKFIKHKSFPY